MGNFFHRISKKLFQTVPNRILTNNNMNLGTIFEKKLVFLKNYPKNSILEAQGGPKRGVRGAGGAILIFFI